MLSSGLCLQKSLRNNIAINRDERHFGTQWRNIVIGIAWLDKVNYSVEILSNQVLIITKIADKWVTNTHSHSDCVSNML